MLRLVLVLVLLSSGVARGAEVPIVTIASPAEGTILTTGVDSPGFPAVGVAVQFEVTGWVYPALGKGVAFGLDAWTPDEAPLVMAQSATLAYVSPIGPGRHTLWACLMVQNGGLWSPLDTTPGQLGVQSACAGVTLDVSIVACHPTLWDPVAEAPVCDPLYPATCCLDANPCSVDSCQWVVDGGVSQYECRYAPVAGPCCQSDLECPGTACDAASHQCVGGPVEVEPEVVEASPETVPEVVEPAADEVEPPVESPVEVVEPSPDAAADPGAPHDALEAASDVAADTAPNNDATALDVSEPQPDVSEPQPDAPSSDPGGAEPGAGDGGGGCAWSASRAPMVPGVLALALVLGLRRRSRRFPRLH